MDNQGPEGPGLFLSSIEDGLRGGEAGERDAIGRARNVVDIGLVEEAENRGGVAAVLSAHAEVHPGVLQAALIHGELNELEDGLVASWG